MTDEAQYPVATVSDYDLELLDKHGRVEIPAPDEIDEHTVEIAKTCNDFERREEDGVRTCVLPSSDLSNGHVANYSGAQQSAITLVHEDDYRDDYAAEELFDAWKETDNFIVAVKIESALDELGYSIRTVEYELVEDE